MPTAASTTDTRTAALLDELDAWLDYYGSLNGASQVPEWLAAFRKLRETRALDKSNCARHNRP